MVCKNCVENPVISRRYSGEVLCKSCFFRSFEKNANKELRTQINILATNSNFSIGKIGVAISGGKDSTVALHILKSYAENRKIKLVGLSVDEGIEGYRSESINCAVRECRRLKIPIEIFSYKELIGMTLNELLKKHPPDASPCSPCGILRRRSLHIMARNSSVDCLVLGHNLDDFSQTVLMNHSRGDILRLIRMAPHQHVQPRLVPRLLPLRRLPEQEVYLYSLLKEMNFYDGNCPFSYEAQRNIFRKILLELENRQPGTRHSLLNGMEKIREDMPEPSSIPNCPTCGEPSGGSGSCVFCREFGSFSV